MRFLDAQDFEFVIACVGGSRGDHFARERNLISEVDLDTDLRDSNR